MKSALGSPDAGEIKLGGYGGKIIDCTIEKQLADVDTWLLLVNQFRLKEDGSVTLCDYAESGKNHDDEVTGLTVWHVNKQ